MHFSWLFHSTSVLRSQEYRSINTWIMTGVLGMAMMAGNGCVYRDPVADDISLIPLLSLSRSSLNTFCYDLSSPVILPFMAHPANASVPNGVTDQSITLMIPYPAIEPVELVIEAAIMDPLDDIASIQVMLNGTELGFMNVTATPFRKVFPLPDSIWRSIMNIITIGPLESASPVMISYIWLLSENTRDTDQLAPGNRFTGYIGYWDHGEMIDSIYLDGDAELSIPIQLPLPSAFFSCSILAYPEGNPILEMELITGRAFLAEEPLQIMVIPPEYWEPDAWSPVEWNLSERRGRHAILKLVNKGSEPIIIRDPVIRSTTSQLMACRMDDGRWFSSDRGWSIEYE